MKTRPLTIVLLGTVVLIWAWIMYSVFDYMDSPEALSVKKKTSAGVLKKDSIVTDYVLTLNYKDPFLKKEYFSLKAANQNAIHNSHVNQQSNVVMVSQKIVKETAKEKDPIPAIQYVGRIQNAKLNKPVAILLIAEHEYMMQEGQENDGVMLKQIMNDSVKVMFSKKMLYVKKH